MIAIQHAYSSVPNGDKSIAMKKAALSLLWSAAGRTGEVALTLWSLSEWDAGFNALAVTWAQMKTSETKIVTVTAGTSHLLCPFLLLGDLFAVGYYRAKDMTDMKSVYIFPQLAFTKDASGSVANMVMDALDSTKSRRLAPFAVTADKVPQNVRADSVRHGASGMLSSALPRNLSIAVTGHNASEKTNFDGYCESVTNSVALQVSGSMTLGCWPPPPYGQQSRGPIPASLDTLNLSQANIDSLADTYFKLIPGLTIPSFLAKGALRPFIIAALASAIMWFPDRVNANHDVTLTSLLRDAYIGVNLDEGDVKATILAHAALIRTQFNLKNLHISSVPMGTWGPSGSLAAGSPGPSIDSLFSVIQGMGAQQQATQDHVANLTRAGTPFSSTSISISTNTQFFKPCCEHFIAICHGAKYINCC